MLKRSIVIVNEYTSKFKGDAGRGRTPKNYILQYMAREEAVERMAPVRFEPGDPLNIRFERRKDLMAERSLDQVGIDGLFDQKMKYAGAAFCRESLSMSRSDILKAAANMQQLFDAGHTVMKTVISFDLDYLKDLQVISPDLEVKNRGDLRLQADHQRLRQAIHQGMKRLGRQYRDLVWIGVCQVDTRHLHCHLTMAEQAEVLEDGLLNAAAKSSLRLGIDSALEESKNIRKTVALEQMEQLSRKLMKLKSEARALNKTTRMQKIVQALPQNPSLWKAESRDPAMKKANGLVRNFVISQIRSPESAFASMIEPLRKKIRQIFPEYRSLQLVQEEYVQTSAIVSDCMNGVYERLRSYATKEKGLLSHPPDRKQTFEAFGRNLLLKMSGYGRKKHHHQKQAQRYAGQIAWYHQASQKSEASRALLEFYEQERQYHQDLADKYEYLCPEWKTMDFKTGCQKRQLEREYRTLEEQIRNLKGMLEDEHLKKMDPIQAEKAGKQRYGLAGASRLGQDAKGLETQLQEWSGRQKDIQNQVQKLLGSSQDMVFRNGSFQIRKEKVSLARFNEVKMLDLHEMQEEIHPQKLDLLITDRFWNAAQIRKKKYDKALDYLKMAGEWQAREHFDGKDIESMVQTAGLLAASLETADPEPVPAQKREERLFYHPSMEHEISSVIERELMEIEF